MKIHQIIVFIFHIHTLVLACTWTNISNIWHTSITDLNNGGYAVLVMQKTSPANLNILVYDQNGTLNQTSTLYQYSNYIDVYFSITGLANGDLAICTKSGLTNYSYFEIRNTMDLSIKIPQARIGSASNTSRCFLGNAVSNGDFVFGLQSSNSSFTGYYYLSTWEFVTGSISLSRLSLKLKTDTSGWVISNGQGWCPEHRILLTMLYCGLYPPLSQSMLNLFSKGNVQYEFLVQISAGSLSILLFSDKGATLIYQKTVSNLVTDFTNVASATHPGLYQNMICGYRISPIFCRLYDMLTGNQVNSDFLIPVSQVPVNLTLLSLDSGSYVLHFWTTSSSFHHMVIGDQGPCSRGTKKCADFCDTCTNMNEWTFCKCPRGFYYNSTGGCSACLSQCSVCYNETLCTLCNPNYYFNGTACDKCPTNCSKCNSTTLCQECISNYELVDSKCFYNCPTGFFRNTSTYGCDDCMDNCSKCSNFSCNCREGYFWTNSSCELECPLRSYADVTARKCLNCSSSCLNCSSFSNCSICAQDFYYFNSNCNQNCPSNYFKNNNTGTCDACLLNCQNCSTSNSCDFCLTNYFWNNQTCELQCPVDSFKNLTVRTCFNCSSNCTRCSSYSNCSACVSNFYYYANSCLETCPEGFFNNPSNQSCISCLANCSNCLDNISCNLCALDTFWNNLTCSSFCPSYSFANISTRSCYNCSQNCTACYSFSSCSACKSNFYLYMNSCRDTCPLGYYINAINQSCEPCMSNCTSCSNLSNCDLCDSNTFWDNNTCGENCPPYSFINITTRSCMNCSTNCSTCSSYSNCSACSSSFYFHKDSCQEACPQGTFTNSTLRTCDPCMANCSSCTSSTTCDLCIIGTFWTNSSCSEFCPSYSFSNTSTRTCYNCSTNCTTCSDLSNCSACKPGHFLYNNTCSEFCPANYYQNHTSLRCENCLPNCATCSNNSVCELCDQGFYWSNTSCTASCPLYSYANTSLRACFNCTNNCTSCVSQTNCSSCENGFLLTKNRTCFSYCPINYFYNETFLTCDSCMQNCSYCENKDICSLCETGSYWNNATCNSSCPKNTFLDINLRKCFNCPQNCEKCSDFQNCSACKVGKYLNNWTCIDNCPLGSYGNVTSGVCEKCNQNCNNCSNDGICLNCVPGFYLYENSSCITDCKFPYTTTNRSFFLFCNSPCEKDTYLHFQNLSCDSKCNPPNNQILYNDVKSCIPCKSLTEFVFTPNNSCISSCDSPFIIYAKQNIQYCGNPCSVVEYYNWDKSCISSCNYPYVQRNTTFINYCDFPCSNSQFLDWNNFCRESCDSPFSSRIINNMALCIGCIPGYFFKDSKCYDYTYVMSIKNFAETSNFIYLRFNRNLSNSGESMKSLLTLQLSISSPDDYQIIQQFSDKYVYSLRIITKKILPPQNLLISIANSSEITSVEGIPFNRSSITYYAKFGFNPTCKSNCAVCTTISDCQQCVKLNVLVENKCYSEDLAPIFYLEQDNSDPSIVSVIFSEKMLLQDNSSISDKLSLNLSVTGSTVYIYNSTFEQNSTRIIISIVAQKAIESQILQVNFAEGRYFTNQLKIPLLKRSEKISIQPIPTKDLIKTVKDITALSQSSTSTSTLIVFLSANPSMLWVLLNLVQNYYYLLFFNVGLPFNVAQILALFQIGTLNIFNFVELPAVLNDETEQGYEKFQDQGFKASFLISGSGSILIMMLSWLLYGLSYTIVKFWRNSPAFLRMASIKYLKKFRWELAIDIWNSNVFNFSATACHQMAFMDSNKNLNYYPSILAMSFFYFNIIATICIFKFIRKNKRNLNNKLMKIFTAELKLRSKYAIYNFPMMALRRILSGALFVVLYTQPFSQILAQIIISGLISLYVIWTRPKKEFIANFNLVTDEIFLMIVYCIVINLNYFTEEPDEKIQRGWIIVLVFMCNTGFNILILLSESALRLGKKFMLLVKAFLLKKKKKRNRMIRRKKILPKLKMKI